MDGDVLAFVLFSGVHGVCGDGAVSRAFGQIWRRDHQARERWAGQLGDKLYRERWADQVATAAVPRDVQFWVF